jgi:murein DD-endopeptidase MepM/ murein hydrolase activator NlpD
LSKDPIHSDSDFIYGGFGDYRHKHLPQDRWNGLDRWHASIDVGNRTNVGLAIFAIYPGRVVATGWDASGFGNYIVIEHSIFGEKYYSVYGHLGTSQENSGITVEVGDWVSTDTQIRSLGNSLAGFPEGAKESDNPSHLHFEVRRATNINLNNTNPLFGQRYWAFSGEQWGIYFLDLGGKYGYAENGEDPAFPADTN